MTLPPSSPEIGSKFSTPHQRLTKIKSLAVSASRPVDGSQGFTTINATATGIPTSGPARLTRIDLRGGSTKPEIVSPPMPHSRISGWMLYMLKANACPSSWMRIETATTTTHSKMPTPGRACRPMIRVISRKSTPIVTGKPKRRKRRPGSDGVTNGILAAGPEGAPDCGARSG